MSERLIQTTRALCLSAAFFITSPALSAEWESLPPLPAPAGGFVCGALEHRLVVVGGTNWEGGKKNWLRTIHEFDPKSGRWETVKDLQDGPAAYAVSLVSTKASEHMHLSFIGGTDGQKPLKSLTIVDGIKTIAQPVAGLPDSIVLSAGGQVGDKIILAGGTNDAANVAGFQLTTVSVERAGGGWKVGKLPDYPGKAFGTAASAAAGGELFVFGGANWDAGAMAVVNANEAHAFSVAKNEWRKLKPLPFAIRGLTAVALDDGHVYLAGGFKTDAEGFTDEAYVYDVKADTYRPSKPLPYRAMVGLAVLDGFVYCLGGEDKQKHRTDKVFRIAVTELLK